MKIENHPKLVKESNSGIIQSTDTDAYKTFVSTREVITKERRKNTYQEERLERLEMSIDELKSMLDEISVTLGVNNA